MHYDTNCRRCPLSAGPRAAGTRVCVPGDGPRPASVALYGEAPAAIEEREARPFVGDAGHELDAVLGRAGLRRADVFIGNVIRCRLPQDHKPNAEEVDACRYYTVQELVDVQPAIIVALGGSALKALTGQSKIGENRGKLLPLLPAYRSDIRVLPTYHPAAYLHNPTMRETYSQALVDDLKLAVRTAHPERAEGVSVAIDEGEARRTLVGLYRADVELAVDVEWQTLKPRNAPEGWWPWSRRGGVYPQALTISFAGRVDGQVQACTLRLSAGNKAAGARVLAERPITLHSAAGDLIWLYSLGFKVRLRHDTLLLASLHHLDTSLSLAALASMLTEMPPAWKRETETTVGRLPRTEAEWEALLERNAQDAVATLLLAEALRKRTLNPQAKRLYVHVLMPAVQQLARASLAGIPMDREMLWKLDRAARKKIARLREEAGEALGLGAEYERVLTSDARLGPVLERVLHVELPRTEKDQRPSVTKDALAEHADKHPAVPKIREARHLQTLCQNYIDPWSGLLDLQGESDNRLHTVYRLATAKTGRTSAQAEAGGTFQQFPREEVFKRAMRAPDGWKVLHVDLSQIEMRIAAWRAQEQRMLQFIREGVDMHSVMAGWIQALAKGYTLDRYLAEKEVWTAQVTSAQRRSAKVYNFGLLFGGTWRVIVRLGRQDYGIIFTQPEAEHGYEAYHALYPDLRAWHESHRSLLVQGYIDLPTGRRRSVVGLEYEDDEGKMRKLINAGPQGIASDLALFCANVTYERAADVLGEYFHLAEYNGFFHDAAVYIVHDDLVDLMHYIIRDTWEHPPLERLRLELTVPLVADVGVGQTWEDAINDAKG